MMLSKERFPDRLITTYISPRLRRLLHDFRYIDPVEGTITCKKGLEIDGASFGRIFSPLFGDQHDYDVPATPHDQLYEDNRVAGQYLTRQQCDRVFYRAMQYAGFSTLIAFVFYVGVRLGGWWPWWRNRRRDAKKLSRRRADF